MEDHKNWEAEDNSRHVFPIVNLEANINSQRQNIRMSVAARRTLWRWRGKSDDDEASGRSVAPREKAQAGKKTFLIASVRIGIGRSGRSRAFLHGDTSPAPVVRLRRLIKPGVALVPLAYPRAISRPRLWRSGKIPHFQADFTEKTLISGNFTSAPSALVVSSSF